MSLLSFASRLRRVPKVAVFDIQGSRFAFPVGTVVARVPWSSSNAPTAANSAAVGYTSFDGELVPVFDMAAKLGLSPDRIGGDEVLIVTTDGGFAAIVVDRFLGNDVAGTDAKVLDASNILKAPVELAPAA